MNRRQLLKGLLAAPVASILPIGAHLAYAKEKRDWRQEALLNRFQALVNAKVQPLNIKALLKREFDLAECNCSMGDYDTRVMVAWSFDGKIRQAAWTLVPDFQYRAEKFGLAVID